MKMGVKMRIYPTKEQEELLFYHCRIAHDMQNYLVAKYKDELPHTNSYGIIGYTPRELINDFNVKVPQRLAYGAMQQYVDAVKRVYNKTGNRPKFHKYDPKKQSFYMKSSKLKVINGYIKCPTTKKYRMMSKNILVDQQYVDKFGISDITEPRFTYHSGSWFITGCYDVPDPSPKNATKYIGLDWGIKNFVTTSDGGFINYPDSVLREHQRIRKLQSIRDKKVKGSNNYLKVDEKITAAFQRLENIKRDFIDKKTTEMCKDANIVVEQLSSDLAFSAAFIRRQHMVAPRVRFYNRLNWKCLKFGTEYIEVEPNNTTKTCCICGVLHGMSLNDRTMRCECGNVMDRDINAAINIRNAALAATGVCCT